MSSKIDVNQKELVFYVGSWTCWHSREWGCGLPAKEALDKDSTDDPMPFLDLNILTVKYIHHVWWKEWDEAVIMANKLHEILPKLSDKLISCCKTWKEGTVLNRLHIGHFYFTHSFILKKKGEPPVCEASDTMITVIHILIEWAASVDDRN